VKKIKMKYGKMFPMPGWVILDDDKNFLGFCWRDDSYPAESRWAWSTVGDDSSWNRCNTLKRCVEALKYQYKQF
jgi:hypothetical protein